MTQRYRPWLTRLGVLLGALAALAAAAREASGIAPIASTPRAVPGLDTSASPDEYVCGRLLDGSANFLQTFLDPYTGLPYDHLECDCQSWRTAEGVCQSSGVMPQLPAADIASFVGAPGGSIDWRFVDDLSSGEDPTLLHALEMTIDLSAPGSFAGVTWGAIADISRYDRLWIRYRTSSPASRFELKLESGLPEVVPAVSILEGSDPDGSWREETFEIASDFPGVDSAHLNRVVFAATLADAGPGAVLWVDHLAFLADPVRAGDCSVVECGNDPGCYPDLSRYEEFTGAVNVANALSALTLLADAGRVDPADAAARVDRILDSLRLTPRFDGWMQDWHSPSSLMPRPQAEEGPMNRRDGSLTDLPQLYAALMVVERSWPELAAKAAGIREGLFDLGDLFEPTPGGPCPGELHPAMDVCGGPQPGTIDFYGNDSLLGAFLAIATGAVPATFWSDCLSRMGCELRGYGPYRWYSTGAFSCAEDPIPAIETGGPFLQLAGLLYLDPARLPIGALSLGDSGANMVGAQLDWARDLGLAVAGWSSHADDATCAYDVCEDFTATVATPYVCGMALGLAQGTLDGLCARNLQAFDQLGAGRPLDSGTVLHDFGLGDAWNQLTGSRREDAFLYLDTGWSTLGALRHCFGDQLRRRFAEHPVAANGYALLATLPLPCQLGTPSPCLADAETACLRDGRFEVRVTWNNDLESGEGEVMRFGGQRAENVESAFYSFRSPTNFELGVKVLDACVPPFDRYWVFISGLTNQGWQLTVRDTESGAVRTYVNPNGHLTSTVADTSAFACD